MRKSRTRFLSVAAFSTSSFFHLQVLASWAVESGALGCGAVVRDRGSDLRLFSSEFVQPFLIFLSFCSVNLGAC